MRTGCVILAFTAASRCVRAASSVCPCGYSVNATDQAEHAIFTEALESDFLHVGDLSADAAGQWSPQAFNASPAASNGPYGRIAQLQNVVPNPLPNSWDWGGSGIHAPDPGLQLYVRSTLATLDTDGDRQESLVPMAEIVSQRTDMLYGSFRIGMKTTGVNGTCGAFFFYFNNSEEIDMEILSRQQDLAPASTSGWINLVVQSPQSAALGYVNDTADFDHAPLPFAPQQGYNEFRFDWLPDRVQFFVNGALARTIAPPANLPDVAGALHVNHWSNGNVGWSAGPPDRDAALTLAYVKAYFNSSDAARVAAASSRCAKATGQTACVIPEQTTPPDPTGLDGNVTGKTFFFYDQAIDPSRTAASSGAATSGTKHGAGARLCAGWYTTLAPACMAALLLSVS